MEEVTLRDARLRLKIVPAHKPCAYQLYINKAGRVVRCGGKGYARHVDGTSRCQAHFKDVQAQAESMVNDAWKKEQEGVS